MVFRKNIQQCVKSGKKYTGLCIKCHKSSGQFQKGISNPRFPNNPTKSNGRSVNGEGYYVLYINSLPADDQSLAGQMKQSAGGGKFRVAEHRLVMARHIHRALTDKEIVRHRDGNRLNNDISNLQLYTTRSSHHPGHDDSYHLLQEALLEIERLKKLL